MGVTSCYKLPHTHISKEWGEQQQQKDQSCRAKGKERIGEERDGYFVLLEEMSDASGQRGNSRRLLVHQYFQVQSDV